MSDHNDEPKKRPAHLWKPGQSGNPKGRPRSGNALTERIREAVPPDALIKLAHEVITSDRSTDRDKLTAAKLLADWGYHKPAERHEVVSGFAQESEDEHALENCTLDELRELRAIETRRSELLAAAAARTALPEGDVIEADERDVVIRPPSDRAVPEQGDAAQPQVVAGEPRHADANGPHTRTR
jgi:hypothetical protein